MRCFAPIVLCALVVGGQTLAADYGFKLGKTQIEVETRLLPISNTGTATVTHGGDRIHLLLENGSDPFLHDNASTEGRARDGTKFRIRDRRMQIKRPGGRHWLTMRLQARRSEEGPPSADSR